MPGRRVGLAIVAAAFVASSAAAWATLGAPAGASPPRPAPSVFRAPKTGYVVYWDQDEEEDYYASATNTEGQLVTPWDPNGQMCLLNDGTGRFVVGYDPTQPSQHNPGGPPHRPYKQPPIGEELIVAHRRLDRPEPVRARPLPDVAEGPGRGLPGGARRVQRPVDLHRLRGRRAPQRLRRRHRDRAGRVPDPDRRSPRRVVRPVVHHVVHPLRPDHGRGRRGPPRRRLGRPVAARDDGHHAQRRPAAARRRAPRRADSRATSSSSTMRRCRPAPASAPAACTRAARSATRCSSRAPATRSPSRRAW